METAICLTAHHPSTPLPPVSAGLTPSTAFTSKRCHGASVRRHGGVPSGVPPRPDPLDGRWTVMPRADPVEDLVTMIVFHCLINKYIYIYVYVCSVNEHT